MNWNFKRRPKKERDPRLHRILSILEKLQEGAKVNSRDLADEFGVSARQILRDLNSLTMAGFMLCYYGTGRGTFWRLHEKS